MDGSDRYELLQKIAGEKIVAFRGRQTLGGQMVLLHQLTGTNDHTDVLKLAVQYLLRSPASAGGRILDLVEIHGLHYIVTLDQPECLALREWLKWELEGPRPAPISAAPATVRDAGDFARFFQNEPKGVAATPAPAVPPPAAEEHVPGEFTQLFGRGGQSQPSTPMMAPPPVFSPPVAQPAPAPPPPLVSEKPQPGEFTRLFRSPLATPGESPVTSLPTTSPSTRTPGEFTRIFGGGTPAGTGSPPPPSSMPAPPPPPPPPATPGPLTESLDPRHAPTFRPETTQSASSGPGEFTRVIRGPGGAAAVSPAPPPPPPAPPAAAPPPVAMPAFSTPPLPAAPSAPSAAAPSLPSAPSMPSVSAPQIPAVSQAPPMGRPSTALIILFVVLLVAALALIAYVIFRH